MSVWRFKDKCHNCDAVVAVYTKYRSTKVQTSSINHHITNVPLMCQISSINVPNSSIISQTSSGVLQRETALPKLKSHENIWHSDLEFSSWEHIDPLSWCWVWLLKLLLLIVSGNGNHTERMSGNPIYMEINFDTYVDNWKARDIDSGRSMYEFIAWTLTLGQVSYSKTILISIVNKGIPQI